MEQKSTLTKTTCEKYHFDSDNHSWTTFIISDTGDLYIYGDWGYYCYSWRAFGKDFKNFLIDITPEYLLSKIESNASLHRKDKITSRQKEALLFFFGELIKIIKSEIVK